MLTYNAIGTYVLVVSLLSALVIVLIVRQGRTRKDLPIWLMSSLVGILLGAAGAGAVVQALGYELSKEFIPPAGKTSTATTEGTGATGMSMGSGMKMGGGMSKPAPSSDEGAQDGPLACCASSPKAQLAILVREINLLTGDIPLHLSEAQTASLVGILSRIKSQQAISDDQAAAMHKQLLDLLDEAQKAKSGAVGLRSGATPGSEGVQEEVANPFEQQQNAEALQSLLDRFSKPAATKPAAAGAP